jgi:Na+-driven multidrug efflux pump
MVLGLYAKEILLFFGQTDIVATFASELVLMMLPGLPFCLMYDLLRRILQGQNFVMPLVVISFLYRVSSFIHEYDALVFLAFVSSYIYI